MEYGIEFTTSFPHYPRGHGLVETHVQTIKRLMSKCREDGIDIDMAILNLRSTPLNRNTPSPAELLNNRRYRSNLPVRIAPPQNYEQIKAQFERKQASSTEYHDQHMRTLSGILPGQHVRVQDHVSRLWKPATVVERAHTPRSYLIEKEDGSQLRRNRQHLRETAEQPVFHPSVDVPEPPGRSLEPAHQPRPPDEQSRPTVLVPNSLSPGPTVLVPNSLSPGPTVLVPNSLSPGPTVLVPNSLSPQALDALLKNQSA